MVTVSKQNSAQPIFCLILPMLLFVIILVPTSHTQTIDITKLYNNVSTDVPENSYRIQDFQLPDNDTPNHRVKLGIILPLIISFILVITNLSFMLVEFFCKSKKIIENTEPQEELIMVLCNEDDAVYQYAITFRVGNPTSNFDMKQSFIDIEILEAEDVVQGCPVRFACSHLPDRVCSSLVVLIGRISPLPDITGIRINHNDTHGTIFLYEFVIKDLLDDDKVIEIRKFNTYLTNRKTIYRGTTWNGGDDDDQADYYPDLPVLEWTYLELITISVFMVMLVNFAVMLIDYFNWYPNSMAQQDGSLYRSLLDVAYVILPSIILLAMVTLTFKYYIKR